MSTVKTLSSFNPITIPSFDEQRWVINIRRSLEEELEDDTQVPVCIFNVPKALISCDPNSYIPQQVAFGPYHYWRLELCDMERYKLMAAKRYQQQLKNDLKFEDVVEQLEKLEACIRACYHKYLDLTCETLVLMMAIDASFMLEFLQVYVLEERMTLHRVPSRGMSHLVDGRKSAHNAILRDIVMLENQIPLFVLRKMLEFEISSLDFADEMLNSMLKGLCREFCPFKRIESFAENLVVSNRHHILDLLYHILVPKVEGSSEPIEDPKNSREENGEITMEQQSSLLKQILKAIWKLLLKINAFAPLSRIEKLVFSKPMKVIFKLPWTILSKIPGVSILIKPCVPFLSSEEEDEEKTNPQNGSSAIHRPPLVEEIAIPSVTQLSKSCVRFSPTKGNICTISFDVKTWTLYLPIITLDVNTEVVLRNLVAYEATNASGPLVLTRYTELMNGIIDSAEDVKLLRERGIILNRLKNDAEAAEMWNGMSRSIRLTKVPYLDKVIEDVNKHHNSRWSVKVCKFFKKKVYSSWQILTFLATITFMLLLMFQSFCSVYSCSTLLRRL
ncbi:hypothetical protein SLE2022_381200 [Rubroshorea leprosula]